MFDNRGLLPLHSFSSKQEWGVGELGEWGDGKRLDVAIPNIPSFQF
jgi:hypothetical protein